MNDAGDNYDRMPIERVDSILRQLRPEYWSSERLRGASPSEKREAVRKEFAGRGKSRVRAGKTARPTDRAATASETIGKHAPPKPDIMSDCRPVVLRWARSKACS
jgi:hypothetical protein